MKVPSKYKLFPLAILLFTVFSCNDQSCEETGTCPEQSVIERTDIIITGDINATEFQQSAESDKTIDLVTYNFYGDPSEYFDFKVKMSSGHTLILRLYNSQLKNPWEQVNVDYAIYPTEELDDKWKYITIDYTTGGETASYASNYPGVLPPGAYIDVFRILSNDGVTIQCRIRDMILMKNTDISKTITLNGTFVGAVTF